MKHFKGGDHMNRVYKIYNTFGFMTFKDIIMISKQIGSDFDQYIFLNSQLIDMAESINYQKTSISNSEEILLKINEIEKISSLVWIEYKSLSEELKYIAIKYEYFFEHIKELICDNNDIYYKKKLERIYSFQDEYNISINENSFIPEQNLDLLFMNKYIRYCYKDYIPFSGEQKELDTILEVNMDNSNLINMDKKELVSSSSQTLRELLQSREEILQITDIERYENYLELHIVNRMRIIAAIYNISEKVIKIVEDIDEYSILNAEDFSENLFKKIYHMLGKNMWEPLLKIDCNQITFLYFYEENVLGLRGIEYLKNLKIISFVNCKIPQTSKLVFNNVYIDIIESEEMKSVN